MYGNKSIPMKNTYLNLFALLNFLFAKKNIKGQGLKGNVHEKSKFHSIFR